MKKYKLEDLPLFLPQIKGTVLTTRGFELRVRVIDYEPTHKKAYLAYRYEDPKDQLTYIFHSHSLGDLIDYLKDAKLLKV